MNHFENYPKDSQATDYKTKHEAWTKNSKDLLIKLLCEISNSLNYNFDENYFKRRAYIPMGHENQELDQAVIRRGFSDVF